MQSYYSAPVWDKSVKLPTTCKTAKPDIYEYVSNAAVVTVTGAKYRNANIDGTFVLSPFFITNNLTPGVVHIDVLCRWFLHRLKSTGLTIKVDLSNAKFQNNYSGDVVSNIEI